MDFQEIFDVALSALLKMLVVVIPILAAILTRAILQFLKQKEAQMKAEGRFDELGILKDFARLAIRAAEQLYPTPPSNGDKATYAIEQLVRLAASAQIPLSYTDAQLIIEGSVKSVKKQVGQYDLLEVEPIIAAPEVINTIGDINIFDPEIT